MTARRMEQTSRISRRRRALPRAAVLAAAFIGALATSSANAAAPTRRIAVLEFRGREPTDVLASMADEARSGVLDVTSRAEYLVMTRENMMSLIREMGASCAEGECEVETAKNIGADLVVTGEVVRVQTALRATLKLHETASAGLLATIAMESDDPLDLIHQVRAKTRDLVRDGLRSTSAASRARTPKTGSPALALEQPLSSTAVPDAEEVVVRFESNPVGAVVRLDGNLLCQATPCSKLLVVGGHDVRMEHERYESSSTWVDVKRGASVSLTLQPLFGWLSVGSEPSGLGIAVAGGAQPIDRVRTPLENLPLEPGTYQVAVDEPCYRRTGTTVTIERGKNASVSLRGDKRQAPVKVVAMDEAKNAVDGDVFVGGLRVGHTGQSLDIPTCTSEIEVRTSAGGRGSVKVQLKEGERQRIEATVRGAVPDYIGGNSPVQSTGGRPSAELARTYRDVGLGLLGLAAVATGVALYGFDQARTARAELDAQAPPIERDARTSLINEGETGNALGVAGVIAGIASLGGGIAFLSMSF